MTDNEEFSDAFLEVTSDLITDLSTKIGLEVMLGAGTGAKYQMPNKQITGLTITQDFFNSYCDKGVLELQVTEKEFREIHQNRQNLSIQVTMMVGDSHELASNAVPKVYKAIIQDYKELDVAVARSNFGGSKSDVEPDEFFPLVLELIEMSIYSIRKRAFHMIYHDVTMENTLAAIASALGFREVYIVPPDNKRVYKNMIIPPSSTLETVFGLLQSSETYGGVYDSGINIYISDMILYVFPLQEPARASSIAHFFNMGGGRYAGAGRYFKLSGPDMHVGITGKVMISDATQWATENLGTMYVSITPDKFIDQIHEVVETEVIINEDLLTTTGMLGPDIGLSDKAYSQKFRSTNNKRVMSRDIYGNITYMASFLWKEAVPFLIPPASGVNFVSDKQSGIQNTPGVIKSISFTLTPVVKTTDTIFTCVSEVILLLTKT